MIISDETLLASFRALLKKRENVLSNGVDLANTEWIYKAFIKPLLGKGQYPQSLSKNDLEKFVGELFALSMYAKKNNISNWIYEPSVEDKSPDFSINDNSIFIEVYTPAINHKNSHINYYITSDRKKLRNEVENKSKQYSRLPLIIIVHVVVGDFTNDLVNSLKKVTLSNNEHSIFLYHGSDEHKLTFN